MMAPTPARFRPRWGIVQAQSPSTPTDTYSTTKRQANGVRIGLSVWIGLCDMKRDIEVKILAKSMFDSSFTSYVSGADSLHPLQFIFNTVRKLGTSRPSRPTLRGA